MNPEAAAFVAGPARAAAPLLCLFAFLMLASTPPGDGVGFRAGLVFALALALHVLLFGVRAAVRAFPPAIARLLMAGGLLASTLAWTFPQANLAARVGEGGLFAATIAASGLFLSVLVGRAPTLRDAP